jgi:hypothetical protein
MCYKKLADIQEQNKDFLKTKIKQLETNRKTKTMGDFYRGINDFKKGYQPRNNIVTDEKGDWVEDSHNILARWRSHSSQLFNIHWINDVRQA